MKLEIGKIYNVRHGKYRYRAILIDSEGDFACHRVDNNNKVIDSINHWFKEDGKKYPGKHTNPSPDDIVSEFIPTEKRQKHIDELSYRDFQPRIEKLWKMGRAF